MKIIAAFFAAVIIVIIFLADANKLPGFLHAIYNIPCGDKVGHFALFGMFCYLSTRAAIASLAYRVPKRVAL